MMYGDKPLVAPKKPQRPYKNFELFLAEKRPDRFKGDYPCLDCEYPASGWIYAPGSQSCPIEGNKMRSRIKCPSCDGTGTGDRHSCKAAYDRAIALWEERVEKWRAEKTAFDAAMKKFKASGLTMKDLQILGLG